MKRCFSIMAIVVITLSSMAQSEPPQIVREADGLSLHKEMFMLPATWSDKYNQKQTEAVFQISSKHRLFGTRFYFAYTQISFWQAYDHEQSAPFRETNYNPEIFYRAKPFAFRNGMVGADIGFEHQSNGQRIPISRSWNLFYFTPYFEKGDLLIRLKLRYRVPEDDKESPDDAVGDDNPDITDYYGHNDLHLYYRLGKGHSVHTMIRGNLSTGKGGALLMYACPVSKSSSSFFTIRISHGYGESMVDYKENLTRIGLGIQFMH